MIIFVVGILFYTFNALTFNKSTDLLTLLANSYVLAFGQFDNVEEISSF